MAGNDVSILYFLNSSTVVFTYSVRWKLQHLQVKCNEHLLINLLLADFDIFAASKAKVFKFTVPDTILYFLLTFCEYRSASKRSKQKPVRLLLL